MHAHIAGCMAQRTRHPLVGALGEEAQEKRRRDGAARQQRYRDKLALEGLTPLDRLSEEALARYQQMAFAPNTCT